MRINKFVALATGMSRRAADAAVAEQRVRINGALALPGSTAGQGDTVALDGRRIDTTAVNTTTIMLHKPAGYVVSRNGQGSRTIYDLLPPEYHALKPVGRLDKDSSGLLLLTNDGALANELTHPSRQKTKIYEIEIHKPLTQQDFETITKTGVDIGDGKPSRIRLAASSKQQAVREGGNGRPCYFLPSTCYWRATLAEGRNRQIRRTFAALDYTVKTLHRSHFGPWQLDDLPSGAWRAAVSAA